MQEAILAPCAGVDREGCRPSRRPGILPAGPAAQQAGVMGGVAHCSNEVSGPKQRRVSV
jgi:hypothetical protein